MELNGKTVTSLTDSLEMLSQAIDRVTRGNESVSKDEEFHN
jgi:hypothetical protein